MVLLSIRFALKEDLQHASAELVYGANLHLPGKTMAPTSASPPGSVQDLISRLKSAMTNLQPVPPRSSQRNTFVNQDLTDCTYIFLCMDAVHFTLTQPYQGPYCVLKKTQKTVTIDRNSTVDSVTIN